MRTVSDLPSRSGVPRGRIGLGVIGGVLVILLLSLRAIAGFYTDYLWFDEVGFTSVWRGVLGAKLGLGIVFTLLFFVLLWVNLAIADRLAPEFLVVGPNEELFDRYRQLVGGRTRLVRTTVAALFALIAGPVMAGQWQEWLLYNNSVPFGTEDPQFGRDIAFYVFEMPFLTSVIDWMFTALVIVTIVTAVAHYLNGGIRVQGPLPRVTGAVKAHLSVLFGAMALARAAAYWYQRFELNNSDRGFVHGPGYTDVKAQLPALNLLVIISVAAVVLFVVNIWLRGWVLPVIAVGLWAFVSVVVGAIYPQFIQRFRVQPAESTREKPYIARNIKATRAAYGLTDVQVKPFDYNQSLTQGDLAENAETIRNIRLWDPDREILQQVFEKLQELRSFFNFRDVDIDRYTVDGRTTQVNVSVRELADVTGSWENTHLAYTHGYGAVLSPANAVTEGTPQFLVKDLPPRGEPTIRQPRVYFGEDLGGYAIVRTGRQEIDFTKEGGNQTSTYQGRGGVQVGSLVRRVALALRFGDPNPLISNLITSDSRAIYLRDVHQRVRAAAPFLRYDADPYSVILNGRMLWVQDAYTTTSRYPYSQRSTDGRLEAGSGLRGSVNYVRNSVKVVIDAYHGDMTFFVVDRSDPLAKAYTKAFPELFTDGEEMERRFPGLRAHLRYPEDLFRVQTDMFGQYHVQDPEQFYGRADAWDVAQDPGSTTTAPEGTQLTSPTGALLPKRERRMDPYYLLMRLPDEKRESFLILQPFVPASKDDRQRVLTAFMVAKSDPGEYGELEVFTMPLERQVDGPSLAVSKIDSDEIVSKETSLLDQRGSQVLFGKMQLIPIERSILYVRPLYVQSEKDPVPALKGVVVVFGTKVVLADTLQGALSEIFGGAPSTDGAGPIVTPGAAAESLTALLDRALRAYATAQEALKRGDLAAYQRGITEFSNLVSEARRRADQRAPTTTTEPSA